MNISSFFKDSKPFSRLLGLFFIFLACSIVAVPFSFLPDWVGNSNEAVAIRIKLLSNGILQLVSFMLAAWLFAKLYTDSPARALGLRRQGRQWILGLVGAVTIVLLIPITDWLTVWNESWTFGPIEDAMRQTAQDVKAAMTDMLSLTSPGDFALQILVVALVPAACEEILFRAALQPTLQALVRNNHLGILLTAVVFSLAHGDLYGFLPRLFLGVLLGYLFSATGSLVVSACAHFVNNLVVVIFFHFHNTGAINIDPMAPLALSWTLTLGCTLGAILLFYIYFVKKCSQDIGNADSANLTTGC